MPSSWENILSKSNISKEDMANNPQAVIDILGFFTKNLAKEEPLSTSTDLLIKDLTKSASNANNMGNEKDVQHGSPQQSPAVKHTDKFVN
jgi:hypothetical protein